MRLNAEVMHRVHSHFVCHIAFPTEFTRHSGIAFSVKDACNTNLASDNCFRSLKIKHTCFIMSHLYSSDGKSATFCKWAFSFISFSVAGKASLFLSLCITVFYSVPWRNWLTWFYPEWHHSCRKKPVYLTEIHTHIHTHTMWCPWAAIQLFWPSKAMEMLYIPQTHGPPRSVETTVSWRKLIKWKLVMFQEASEH